VIRNIDIVTGPGGTRIYVNAKLTCENRYFRPFAGKARGPWRISVGGSLSGKYTWTGTLFCLSIASSQAAGSPLVRGRNSLDNAGRAAGSIVNFTFDKEPPAVPGSSVGHKLVVRPRFPVVPEALVPPWKDFTNDASYYADIAVNVIGFLPFGFFFSLFLLQGFIKTGWKIVVAVVTTGFFISLSIELLQVFIPGRSSQLSDVITDTFGTFAGVCACIVMMRVAHMKRSGSAFRRAP
jgi:hypothetical protein